MTLTDTKKEVDEKREVTSASGNLLALVDTYCPDGYYLDENGVCQKAQKKKTKELSAREKRSSSSWSRRKNQPKRNSKGSLSANKCRHDISLTSKKRGVEDNKEKKKTSIK